MPTPTVRGNESQDSFMGRCMHWAKDEFDDQDQRVAVCMGIWRDAKKAEGGDVNKQIAITEKMKQIHEYLKKQLASFKTTVNGDEPHFHYFEIDSAGNGSTVTTVSTEESPDEVPDHTHNISKWEVRSANNHTHALDKVVKAKRGRPKKVCMKTPSREMFKTYEEFDKAMKAYLGRKSKSNMAKTTHITKSYLTAVMRKALVLITQSGKK